MTSSGLALLLLVVLAVAAWCWLLARVGVVAARMYQIEEYEGRRLFGWGATPAWLLHRAAIAGAALTALGSVAAVLLGAGGARSLLAAAWLVGAGAAALAWRWITPKKELVLTPRMRRLLAAAAALGALVAAAIGVALALLPLWAAATVATLALLAVAALSLVLLVAANRLMAPLEAAVRRGFLRRARSRLEAFDPLVIAVAGSYGKTSTKHILAHLLQQYAETLATPKSFNTLMGVCRTVNDVLEERHRTFIVEMDAYAPGEIAAICDLVRPRHALITSVGPQHLERFGTLERIGAALYEAVDGLPEQGFAVIHVGDPLTAALAARARTAGHEVIGYATDSDSESAGADVVASSVLISGDGARFTWSWPARQLSHEVAVPLLGRHQVLNVSAALATVHRLGLPLGPALAALETLRPVEHRLQPVPTGNAITVIDDSYNANPVGVHNGLEVLQELQARARILVTPGLVELGDVEESENFRYGEHAARVCDHVIVMEARPGRALRDGLRAGGMHDDRIHLVRSLAEATAVIGRVARPGDAVLFANDLPDTYLGAA